MDLLVSDQHFLDRQDLSKAIPEEIATIIRHGSNPEYLDALSRLATDARLTARIFAHYEQLAVDLTARWLETDQGAFQLRVASAFARILPLFPQVAGFAAELFSRHQDGLLSRLSQSRGLTLIDEPSDNLTELLLAAFRLLNFDNEAFAHIVSPVQLHSLFGHESRTVRYLAIRTFGVYMHAADGSMECMMSKYLGEDSVEGPWDGTMIDYRLFSLWEMKRLKDFSAELGREGPKRSSIQNGGTRFIAPQDLSRRTAAISGLLLPRVQIGVPVKSSFVQTETTSQNLRSLAEALLEPTAVLLTGRAGSGKTSLVLEAAREMNVLESMVTLHLNEQTDAKMLLGMYTTTATPGSFTWQPGVLTTAVREGRWVVIEDLDHAPAEVIGVLLPLIESHELFIPNRKERIHASRGFKLIGTMRSNMNLQGEENTPGSAMLGNRLWHRVQVSMPSIQQLQEIVATTFPLLHNYLPMIMRIYRRMETAGLEASHTLTITGRKPDFRDLMKWCERIHERLQLRGVKNAQEPISEDVNDEMFMDAVDCFAAFVANDAGRLMFASYIAEEMHISPQRMHFILKERVPAYVEEEKAIKLGRVSVPKKATKKTLRGKGQNGSPFAATNHAVRLMERVGAAICRAEPVLLVGETGIGKTSLIQQLARTSGRNLTVVNLSQQSESGDLIGGFKPVNMRSLAQPMKEEFDSLFETTFSSKKNQKYMDASTKSVARGNWARAVTLWKGALKMAENALEPKLSETATSQPAKKRKLNSPRYTDLKRRWENFANKLKELEVHLSSQSNSFAFSFVEGNIVKAVRDGDWVLLDEINLASSDTLETIADLLRSDAEGSPFLLLPEMGNADRVKAHPDFRVFGSMNPATDAGKRNLASGIRSRFTEIYVDSFDNDADDLAALVSAYLRDLTLGDDRAVANVTRLYMEAKRLENENRLVDGAGQRPHYSIRTLTRTLTYVVDIVAIYGLRRSLYEGFSMSFLTVLDEASRNLLATLLDKFIVGNHRNPRSLLGRTPKLPSDGKDYVAFQHYWMPKGSEPVQEQPYYILTPFIQHNLLNLVRATSTRRFPVLIQGPTSSGKTSMIEYLAKISGNKFVRVNNHEHTDLQEYLGSYVSGADGKLRYQEGVLVEALRNGHWIVLDELNLAPTDVLEALNRLLDDNRELLLPETQQVIRPHPNFMLFATQNPAGLYGGRKVLSRAFRNRFLELHFDDIPEHELQEILERRTQLPASRCRNIVRVYQQLSQYRQNSRLFEQKNSFATLRDLFRWALRKADDDQQLATNGFMLLAERVRNEEERAVVKSIIERVMKVKIDEEVLYSSSLSTFTGLTNSSVIWTRAMRRLFVLVSRAIDNNEPVLLVGETGAGKTQACQVLAQAQGKTLHTINAHMNTETGDLIGSQRPIRNRGLIEEQLRRDLYNLLNGVMDKNIPDDASLDTLIAQFSTMDTDTLARCPAQLRHQIEHNIRRSKALFEWTDGALVQAMKTGDHFLLDEISLADDSVLERLNSVLESQRTLLLAEKGTGDSLVVASEGFQFLATMNPGGDYGKRELSAALRNRFTEIWVPPLSNDDILEIVSTKVHSPIPALGSIMVQFAAWFKSTFSNAASAHVSLRDLLAWTEFVNTFETDDPWFVVVHGAAMVFIDALGANPAAMLASAATDIAQERLRCLSKLTDLMGVKAPDVYSAQIPIHVGEDSLQLGHFPIELVAASSPDTSFVLDTPTTTLNAMRVARALQVPKPILLEGSPGVGKTTLVVSLARAIGKPITRINLSEQTDLTDLFGSDVPAEGEEAGHFTWCDAPFLRAMQAGDWVLLDEMNLASQSVLEGLNSCLDHRGEIYVSELDQMFRRHPNFVLFAAQNPHHQGGGRKGLPASFVNRFTVVYADAFRVSDLSLICNRLFPKQPDQQVERLVEFITQLNEDIARLPRLCANGGPWELNLRDILRWLHLLEANRVPDPEHYLGMLITQRFRSEDDRAHAAKLFHRIFQENHFPKSFYHNRSALTYQVGLAVSERDPLVQHHRHQGGRIDSLFLPIIESLLFAINQKWPSILVGTTGCGKTRVLKHLAAMSGTRLVEFAMNSDVDTMDLIGGYEQVDGIRHVSNVKDELSQHLERDILAALSSIESQLPTEALELLQNARKSVLKKGTLASLRAQLHRLANRTSNSILEKYSESLYGATSPDSASAKVRFEWTDGILIQALEKGDWLVLDNANLCSSSVLDRLNSLLEPNGFLIVNEHHTSEGSTRIVRPHPNFRLFMTMDPRHGDLSRAMRNRSVEIFFMPQPTMPKEGLRENVSCPAESRTSRLATFQEIDWKSIAQDILGTVLEVGMDQVGFNDLAILPSFADSFHKGLVGSSGKQQVSLLPASQRVRKLSQDLITRDIRELYNRRTATLSLDPEWEHAQPLHPLINPLAIADVPDSNADIYMDPFWLAKLYELAYNVLVMTQALSDTYKRCESIQISGMTVLERSLASFHGLTSARNSKTNIAEMLHAFPQWCSAILVFIVEKKIGPGPVIADLNALMALVRDVVQFTQHQKFDEAVFQAFLNICRAVISRLESAAAVIGFDASGLRKSFNSTNKEFNLLSGLSLERMWVDWRPVSASSLDQLQGLLDIESIDERFKKLMWKTRAPLRRLADIQKSLRKTYTSVLVERTNARPILDDVGRMISDLEGEPVLDEEPTANHPFFEADAEGLLQCYDLHMPSNNEDWSDTNLDMLAVLSGRSLTSQIRPRGWNRAVMALLDITNYSGLAKEDTTLKALRGVLPASMLSRLRRLDDVTLDHMGLLRDELDVIAYDLSRSTSAVADDQLSSLNKHLCSLLRLLFEIHQDMIDPKFYALITDLIGKAERAESRSVQGIESAFTKERMIRPDLPADHYLGDVLQSFLFPAVLSLNDAAFETDDKYAKSAAAWIHLALGCLRLFVPDKSFDPATRPTVERQRHAQRKKELHNKKEALQRFEEYFSGQTTNIRIELIQRELEALGEEPPVPAIVRPEQSEISQLQGDLSNLLNIVNRQQSISDLLARLSKRKSGGAQDVKLMLANLSQVSRRLSRNYRAYDDITVPIVRMIECLQIGLALSKLSHGTESDTLVKGLSKTTPYLGGSLLSIREVKSNTFSKTSASDLDQSFRFLEMVTIASSVGDMYCFNSSLSSDLGATFHGFYEQWKEQLALDQENAAATSGLYRFKDRQDETDEIHEDDIQELFPSFEDSSSMLEKKPQQANDPRGTAIKLADLQASILSQKVEPEVIMERLLLKTAARLGSIYDTHGTSLYPLRPENILPVLLLKMARSKNTLSEGALTQNTYNFYVDSNPAEARKLVNLVYAVQTRFRQIQVVWPEHATLGDVIRCCAELLDFKHTEPVAKFLTKSEKLHGYIHEWQVVASKEFSAAGLYDELTNTLVSWRRLELSTWARLFDIEQAKCEEDARSWWFVAYEAIVAAPLELVRSQGDLQKHAIHLLSTMETFFSSTTIGQYSQRFRLANYLKLHLELLANEYESLTVIVRALENFLAHYARFQAPIEQHLANERKKLEKAVKQEIQLASWRDTNIIALKESARRSHLKLLKAVRKYRALLGKPAEPFVSAGLQEPSTSSDMASDVRQGSATIPLDQGALEICTSKIGKWASKPARFLDPSRTASNMRALYVSSQPKIEVVQSLDTFVTDVMDTIDLLKKQTPSTLKEDNKDMVKHLKARKRRYLAEKLKDLKQMGIRSNLPTDTLEKQNSLALVLATTKPLISDAKIPALESAATHFHRFLDIVPKARQAVQNHSDELTAAEVVRGSGYVEGLLAIMLQQRGALSNAYNGVGDLQKAIEMTRNTWSPKARTLQKMDNNTSNGPEVSNAIQWLPGILRLGHKVIETHAQLGKFDWSSILQWLREQIEEFTSVAAANKSLPRLPSGTTSSLHQQLVEKQASLLEELKTKLQLQIAEHPLISFALKQTLLWTEVSAPSVDQSNGYHAASMQDLDEQITTALDAVLVTIQRVQENLASAPTSEEDNAWFTKSDQSLSSTMKALHIDKITSLLGEALEQIQHIEDFEQYGQVAGALFHMSSPIFCEYLSICDDVLARYADVHRATCRMSYMLTKSFVRIATEGFCSPSEASNTEQAGDKLESGTGLGEGEGAEDISKDIEEDEDLSELAQQPDQKEGKEEIEDEKDAVDMAQEDMEGEMGSEGGGSDDEERGEDDEKEDGDIDEETGDVDDLDPSAVDEKLWDGDKEEEQKEMENDKGKGKSQKDDQAAADNKGEAEGNEGEEMEEDEGDEDAEGDESEQVAREEAEQTDPHMQEEQTLDLPDEMQLDGDQKSEGEESDAEGMDELSDIDAGEEDKPTDLDESREQQAEPEQGSEIGEEDIGEEDQHGVVDTDPEADGPEKDEEEDRENKLQTQDEQATGADDAAQSEAQAAGVGAEQEEGEDQEQQPASAAQRDAGTKGTSDQPENATDEGQEGVRQPQAQPSSAEGALDDALNNDPQAQAFKKLGDVLEQWHRQQSKIKNATEREEQADQQVQDIDMGNTEFEHLAGEEDQADTQALGGATEEQAKALDESNAVDSEVPEQVNEFMGDAEQPEEMQQAQDQMDVDEVMNEDRQQDASDRPSAFINQTAQRRDLATNEASENLTAEEPQDIPSIDLSTMHLTTTAEGHLTPTQASALWHHYTSLTHPLSLTLTQQLRLILTPTLATSLRGDFRTGKRLNIKRIIPYIASQYKRDKIWLRRSVPQKRSYQILLAVDDSKSMLESGSDRLAFETLALVSRSLAMLEVGQVGVVAFGDSSKQAQAQQNIPNGQQQGPGQGQSQDPGVRLAHAFDQPLTHEAGARIFSHFTFQQRRTDVRKLIADSIALFRDARAKGQSGSTGNAELWQLELIISDGICEDHEDIRRLVRQAHEERIMIVFVIIDAQNRQAGTSTTANDPTRSAPAQGPAKTNSSIMDLPRVTFEKDPDTGESKMVVKRYLDDFPFRYYLVVGDVADLPGVLAGALKQWFGEVVESG